MSYKATINGTHDAPNSAAVSERGSARAFVDHAADVMHDIAELAELQAQLFVTDSKSVARRTIISVIILAIGLAVMVGLVPVALIGLAEVFVEQGGLTRWIALFASAGCGLVVAIVILLAAWWRLRHGFAEFGNSREELKRNVTWIKQSIKNGGMRHAPRDWQRETWRKPS